MAYTDDELDFLDYIKSVGATLGHPMQIIGPDEIRRLHPFYNLDGINMEKASRFLHYLRNFRYGEYCPCPAVPYGLRFQDRG